MRPESVLIVLFSVCMFQCSEDEPGRLFTDPRDGHSYKVEVINDISWFAEDLNLRGQNLFTYNQALLACPDGWRLPDQEEWHQLLTTYGGYVNVDVPVGNDLDGAFNRLTGDLNFASDTTYWGGGAYWRDAPFIRTDVFRFNSGREFGQREIIKSGSLRAITPHRCRCVADENKEDTYISVKTDSINNIYRYGIAVGSSVFYNLQDGIFVSIPESLVITAFGDLTKQMTENFFYLTLPKAELINALSGFQGSTIETNLKPFILLSAKFEDGTLIDAATSGSDANVQLILHSFENNILEGEVRGEFTYPEEVAIQNLTFRVSLANIL